MIEEIRTYLTEGKISDALEAMINYCAQHGEQEYQTKAIYDISRLNAIEDKILDGVISHESAELEKNKIRKSSIKLLTEFTAEFKDKESPIADNGREEHSLVGKWHCRYFDVRAEKWLHVHWYVKADNTYSVELYTDDDKLNKKASGKWKLDGNIYIDKFPNGKEGKGVIEWVNKDKIIYTIFISEFDNLNDFKKVYLRMN